jgi:hypothetical protein
MPSLAGQQAMKTVVFLIRCGHQHHARGHATEHGRFDSVQTTRIDVLDRFDHHGGIEAGKAAIGFFEGAITHLDSGVGVGWRQPQRAPSLVERAFVDVDADDAGELRMPGKALQQFPRRAAEIEHSCGASAEQVLYHGIETLFVHFGRHGYAIRSAHARDLSRSVLLSVMTVRVPGAAAVVCSSQPNRKPRPVLRPSSIAAEARRRGKVGCAASSASWSPPTSRFCRNRSQVCPIRDQNRGMSLNLLQMSGMDPICDRHVADAPAAVMNRLYLLLAPMARLLGYTNYDAARALHPPAIQASVSALSQRAPARP